jgi:MFS family permease
MIARRYFRGWNVVIGSGVGISFGSIPFFASGFALLTSAMAREFGWTQSEVAEGATIFLLCQTASYFLCGWPLDRWGSRRFAAASIIMFAISLVALGNINGSVAQYYMAFALIGFLTVGTNGVSYARAISQWFDRRRGMALGLASASQSVGLFLIPTITQRLIAQFGWPFFLFALAAFEVAVCLPVVLLLVRDTPTAYGLRADGEPPRELDDATPVQGESLFNVVRNATFWKLTACYAILGMSMYAIAPNVVYILTKRAGLSLAEISQVIAMAALAFLVGRVGMGYFLDKIHARLLAVFAVLLSATHMAILATATTYSVVTVAAVLGGLANGGESDLVPYLASRYFGMRIFSRIYGWFLFAWFLGAAIGPWVFARLMVAYDGATAPLLLLAALQIVPTALFLTLGRYLAGPARESVFMPIASDRVVPQDKRGDRNAN